jgi:Domain of unknown function (DUF4157)
MSQKRLTESPEKMKQRIERRESRPNSARSFHGEIHSPVLQLQRTLGNRHVAALIQAKRVTPQGKIIGLQPKLTVGAADDRYEQEADRVARQVLNIPDAVAANSMQRAMSPEEGKEQKIQTKPLAASITPIVQRQTGKENEVEEDKDKDREEEKDETIQAKSFNESAALPLQRQMATEKEELAEPIQAKIAGALSDTFEAGADVETQVSLSKGRGSPLPDSIRAYMEPRFGADFSAVRVHTSGDAQQMNQAVGAHAFTHGSDIYFGAGSSPTNLELTAHELTHVLQQTGGEPSQTKKQEQLVVPGPDASVQPSCVVCATGITPFLTRDADPDNVRANFACKMRADLGDLHIHTNSSAIQMNEERGAHAFTHGTDIYFNQGKYNPHSSHGQRLMTHELTHVIQQTGRVQTFQPPDIQKFDAHEKIQEQLRLKNPEMITEAPIAGGDTLGKSFTKLGYADLYKSTGSVIPGIVGAKYAEETDKTTGQKTEKYAYKNLTEADSLKKPVGTFTRNPQFVTDPVSVIYETGSVKYFVKRNEVPASTKGTLVTGAFPQDFYVGDIKKGDDSLTLAETQLRNYRKGLHEFSQLANRDFGISATKEGQLYKDVRIPEGLDYSQFATQNATLGDGHLTDKSGKYLRRYWLYPYTEKGLYLYIWLPHPWALHVPKFQQAGKDVMDELDKVNKGLKVTQKQPGKTLGTKRKEDAENKKPTAPTVQHAVRKKTIQRDTDWAALKTSYLSARKTWIDKHAAKYLKKGEIDTIVEEKVEFDKKVGIPASAHGDFAKVAKQFKQIEFWAGPKGLAVGELRFLLGDKFDKLADKFEEIKKRTKKTGTKADALSGKKISLSWGWKKKVVELLMDGVKIGFKVFIAETYSIFSGCIGGMIQKFQEGFTNMEEVETLATQLEGLKTQVESLLNKITTEYEAQMKYFDDILDQMEDMKYYAEILSTAETLIRAGVQIVSCFSPPGLGCLWGLVAQAVGEVGLNLVVGTEWFENKFMRPLVKDLIDKFLKEDILSFMNKLFKAVGLGDYMKDVNACKVSVGASAGAAKGWYSGTPMIPASQYKKHATAWEAANKDHILGDIAAAFNGGTSGKTVTKDDIEKLMKEVQKKNMSADEFKSAVQTAKKGEHKYDFNAVQGAVQASGGGQGEAAGGSAIPVIDARKKATEDADKGTAAVGVEVRIDAKTSHTKGSSPELTIWLFENGAHIATAVNVPSDVIDRKWWPSEREKKKWEIHYLIPKKIPFIREYFIIKGSTLVGYAEP